MCSWVRAGRLFSACGAGIALLQWHKSRGALEKMNIHFRNDWVGVGCLTIPTLCTLSHQAENTQQKQRMGHDIQIDSLSFISSWQTNKFLLACELKQSNTIYTTGRRLEVMLASSIILKKQLFQAQTSSLCCRWLHLVTIARPQYCEGIRGTHTAAVTALDFTTCCRAWCSHSEAPWLKAPQVNWDHFMGLREARMSDLHFQAADEDFITSLCHTERVHSLTTLTSNPQVTVKAELYISQGKVHRDVFPFWVREITLCLAVSRSAWAERERQSTRFPKTGLPSDLCSLPEHISKDFALLAQQFAQLLGQTDIPSLAFGGDVENPSRENKHLQRCEEVCLLVKLSWPELSFDFSLDQLALMFCLADREADFFRIPLLGDLIPSWDEISVWNLVLKIQSNRYCSTYLQWQSSQ